MAILSQTVPFSLVKAQGKSARQDLNKLCLTKASSTQWFCYFLTEELNLNLFNSHVVCEMFISETIFPFILYNTLQTSVS